MPTDNNRNYEMVTPEELRRIRSRNFKYPDIHRAIRALKKMAAGEGIKIQCTAGKKDALKKQKAAAKAARKEGVTIRTMVHGEWLFIEKTAK
jgi:chromosome segregation and condensation protein ScpB